MKVKCINKKCNREWDYKGKSNNYISCPLCLYRFKLQRAIENMLNYVNITNNIHNNIVKKEVKNKDSIEVEPHIFVEKKLVKQYKEANNLSLYLCILLCVDRAFYLFSPGIFINTNQ